jgi:hypothetical protein
MRIPFLLKMFVVAVMTVATGCVDEPAVEEEQSEVIGGGEVDAGTDEDGEPADEAAPKRCPAGSTYPYPPCWGFY